MSSSVVFLNLSLQKKHYMEFCAIKLPQKTQKKIFRHSCQLFFIKYFFLLEMLTLSLIKVIVRFFTTLRYISITTELIAPLH